MLYYSFFLHFKLSSNRIIIIPAAYGWKTAAVHFLKVKIGTKLFPIFLSKSCNFQPRHTLFELKYFMYLSSKFTKLQIRVKSNIHIY